MIEKEKNLLEKLELGSFSATDLDGGNKRRIRNIIKNYKEYNLSDNAIKNLWYLSSLKWDIVRNIALPQEIIDDIASKLNVVDDRVFREFLRHQELNDKNLQDLNDALNYEHVDNTVFFYSLLAWSTLTNEMHRVNDLNTLSKRMKKMNTMLGKKSEIIQSEVVTICRKALDILPTDEFIVFFSDILYAKSLTVAYLLEIMSKSWMDDKILYSIKCHENVSKSYWKYFITRIVQYNNCSKKFKTKYLLKQ